MTRLVSKMIRPLDHVERIRSKKTSVSVPRRPCKYLLAHAQPLARGACAAVASAWYVAPRSPAAPRHRSRQSQRTIRIDPGSVSVPSLTSTCATAKTNVVRAWSEAPVSTSRSSPWPRIRVNTSSRQDRCPFQCGVDASQVGRATMGELWWPTIHARCPARLVERPCVVDSSS